MKTKDPDTLKRIDLLIEDGEKLDFERGYDFSAVLKWIEATSEVLCDFAYEHREFLLYCLASHGMPAERVGHALWILRKVRNRLQGHANY